MRITTLLVAFVTGLTLAGCGGTIEEAPPPEAVIVDGQTASEVATTGNVTAQAICPLKWTCDSWHYYSTQTTCETYCGVGNCYRDYACNGTCVCP
jgi:hypothetical protein